MNIKNKFNKLSVKTLLYLVTFSVFLLLLLWGSEKFLSKYLYEKYQLRDLNKITEEILDTDSEDLPALFEDIVYNNSICIEYMPSDGNTSFYNINSQGCLLWKKNDKIERQKLKMFKSGDETSIVRIVNEDYDSYGILYGLNVDNGYVYLFSMLSSTNKYDSVINNQIFYFVLLILFMAFIVCMFLSRAISYPIVEITNKAKSVAKGNYNVKFNKNGVSEIDDLADTLNYLESEVSKTDQYRRDLMANVSHDLKTPLTMIKAYAEMVRDISYKDDKKREEHLNVIIDEADRLNLLVGDILTLSKIQASADSLEITSFDLKKEIEGILNKYSIVKETENYIFEVNMPDKIMVNADKNKINQVIYNLVNNAINYTGDDNLVKINVIEEKKDYLVQIIDTGKGIDSNELDHIWDKYYKNEKNHKRSKVGSGIGLSIVKGILENHNFDYGVNSTLNVGTTFYFRIKKSSNKK